MQILSILILLNWLQNIADKGLLTTEMQIVKHHDFLEFTDVLVVMASLDTSRPIQQQVTFADRFPIL